MIPVKSIVRTACVAATISIALAQTGPTVQVTGGEIRGRALGAGATFKGIPYAAPPVGDLRWREPGPVKAWTGVRDAGAYGAVCAQIGGTRNPAATRGEEDCLSLNLWTPDWPAKSKLPVMVWFHGGGNQRGSSLGLAGIEPPFDGESLSRHGVVMVTVNYRLGVLGFFSHPALTAESPHHASGNYGLMDQLASLKWVKENIAKFGGDPANVTIFGQSAGARDTSQLLASPLSKGLFHRAIEESGTVIGGGKLNAPLSVGEKIGSAVGERMHASADAAGLAQMRAAPLAEVLKAAPAYDSGQIGQVVVDGYVVTKAGGYVFQSGQEQHVPLLIGNNSVEQGGPAPDAVQKAITEHYGALASRALKLYAQPSAYPPYRDLSTQYGADMAFRCPSVVVAEWHSAAGMPTYEYEFSHAFPEAKIGAPHSGELRYVFGNFPAQPTDQERKISEGMEVYWTNFARTGDPNGNGQLPWPKFDSKARRYIEFTGDGPVQKEALRHDYCELFAEDLKARMEKGQ